MDSLECEKCKYRFSQKSSLVRHSKRCMQRRNQNARQKSCRNCTEAKTRCDLSRPSCSRCTLRQNICQYSSNAAARSNEGSESNLSLQNEKLAQPGAEVVASSKAQQASGPQLETLDSINRVDANLPALFGSDQDTFTACMNSSLNNFGNLETHETNSQLMTVLGLGSSQAALSLLPSAANIPNLVHHSMEYILRVLRTWPRMIAKGIQLPPMIHPSQVPSHAKAKWLSNCFTIVKMWAGACFGTDDIVQSIVKKEMQEILGSYQSFDEASLLTALQALSMYLLILLFPSNDQTSLPLLDEDMFKQIRQVVYHMSTSGLVLEEETNHVRPSWESWIHITTKRRAVLTLYLIHWSYSVYHKLPSFDCRDLGFMPAPAAKYLWASTDRKQWESLYTRWLAQWDGSDFYQWEFFEITSGIRMTDRAEMWLEDADEFGMIFVSILNASEREPEFEIIHL